MKQRTQIGKIPPKYRKEVERQLSLFSTEIQDKRKQMGMSQEILAERLDVSPMTIQFIEQGRRFPSLPMLLYVCDYLGIKIEIVNTSTGRKS